MRRSWHVSTMFPTKLSSRRPWDSCDRKISVSEVFRERKIPCQYLSGCRSGGRHPDRLRGTVRRRRFRGRRPAQRTDTVVIAMDPKSEPAAGFDPPSAGGHTISLFSLNNKQHKLTKTKTTKNKKKKKQKPTKTNQKNKKKQKKIKTTTKKNKTTKNKKTKKKKKKQKHTQNKKNTKHTK